MERLKQLSRKQCKENMRVLDLFECGFQHLRIWQSPETFHASGS